LPGRELGGENGRVEARDAVTNQDVEFALRERVKELTCLYGIASVAERTDLSLEEVLQSVVELLPPAWRYPEIAFARIALDERAWEMRRYREGGVTQRADIVVREEHRGFVEVGYDRVKVASDDEPFLKEERHLIDAVARDVSMIVERREAEHERERLEEQLRHADRLATIGQLSAGLAHELNEPLGSILGFSQLAKKCPDLPEQAAKDLGKIESASLHAREIIRKLLVFARQMPPRKVQVDLNRIVEEGISIFGSRCVNAGIDVSLSLADRLTEITADPVQLNQVFVNLVVNAIQAMPKGGALRVETAEADGRVALVVEDSGVGMPAEIVQKIFLPFFTTKDVHEGTGLGLAVVHGIVTAHGGDISVSSEEGKGSRFKVNLPVREPEHSSERQGDGTSE